ncbi:MAG: MMPL family transporter [Vicinamibacteria bacterium]|nr:MMPL family transporter [Vicinamibacteria bacterium]
MNDPSVRAQLASDPLNLLALVEPFLLSRFSPSLFSIVTGDRARLRGDLGHRDYVFLKPKGSAEDSHYCRDLVARIDQACRNVAMSLPDGSSIRYEFLGLHALTARSTVVLQREIIRITAWATFLLLLLLFIALRRVSAVFVVFFPLLLSMAALFLFARLFFNPIYFITIGFVAIVLGLGLDISLHLAAHLLISKWDGKTNRREAVRTTMIECAWPLMISTISTALAFIALLFTNMEALIQFALLTSAGLLITMATTFCLFPCLVRLLIVHETPGGLSIRILPQSFFGGCVRKRGWCLVTGMILIAACLPSCARFKFNIDLKHLFPAMMPELDITRSFERESDASLTSTLQISIDAPSIEIAKDVQKSLDERLQADVRSGRISCFESPSNHVPYSTTTCPSQDAVSGLREMLFSLLRKHHIKVTPNHEVYGRLLERMASISENGMDSFAYNADLAPWIHNGQNRIRFLTSVWPSRTWAGETLFSPVPARDLQMELDGWSHPADVNVRVFSTAHLLQSLQQMIRRQFAEISWISIALVFGFVFLCFRRIRPSIMSLAPLFGALPVMAASVVVFNIPFTPTGIAFIAIVLGVGIDDAVHLITRSGSLPADSFARAFAEIGPVLTLTSFTTAIGFGSLTLSSHPVVSSLGMVVSTGVMACWLFTMLFMPFLLVRRTGSGRAISKGAAALVFLTLIAPHAMPQETDVNDLLLEIQRDMADIKACSCQFSAEKKLSELTRPVILEGNCLFQQPDRFRIEVTGDERLLILSDGGAITLIDLDSEDLETFAIDEFREDTNMGFLPLAWRFDPEQLKQRYTMHARVSGSSSKTLELTPRDAESPVAKVAIELVSRSRIKRATAFFKNGDRIQTTFRKWRKRNPVGESTFRFSRPQ